LRQHAAPAKAIRAAGGALVESLRQQHRAALAVLVLGETARAAIDRELEEVLAEGKPPLRRNRDAARN